MTATSTPRVRPKGVECAAPEGRSADEMGFDTLVKLYYRKVYRLLLRMVHGDTHVASDLAQDVFVQAFRSLPNFRGDSKIYTWLYRITVSKGISWLRGAKHAKVQVVGSADDPIEIDDMERDEVDRSGSPEQILQRRELQTKVNEAIATLSPNFQQVIVLFDFENLSYQEIAEVLGIPEGTVKSRLNRARYELRKLLRPYYDSDLAVPG